MKTINRKTRIVVSLLMVLVMLFSTLAVTVSAKTKSVSDTVQEVVNDLSVIPTNTPWYTIKYTAPANGEAAKLDVQITPDVSALKNVSKEDVVMLLTEVYELVVKYAVKLKLDSYIDLDKLNLDDFKLNLLSDSSMPDLSALPESIKNMIKDYAKEKLGVESLAELEEKLETDAGKAEIQSGIEAIVDELETAGSAISAVVGTVLQATDATEEEIADLVENINNLANDVIEKAYGVENPETGLIEIPADKQNIVDKATSTINKTVENATNDAFSIVDVAKMFKAIKLNGESILTSDGNFDINKSLESAMDILNSLDVNVAPIIELLKEIPTPGELSNYTVEQYKNLLSFNLGIEFYVLGEFNVDLSFGMNAKAEHIEKLNAILKIVSDYIEIDFSRIANGGEVEIYVKVPAYFAKLVLKAAESNMLPDYIKHKMFTCLNKNGNDIVAFVNENLSVNDIVTVLQYIDYEKIIDASLGKEMILALAKKFGIDDNLDGLTNEQIDALIEKIANKLGKYYNAAMPYVVKAAGYVNDIYPPIMEKTLSDLYKGDGVFHAAEDVTITEERIIKVINKMFSVTENHLPERFEKYEGYLEKIRTALDVLVAYAMNGRTFTVAADVTVEFVDIRQVTFVDGDNTVKGFLPKGADINFFANNEKYLGWMDADKHVYTTMPNEDIVLYPVGDGATSITYNGEVVSEVNGEYNKNGYTLTADVNYAVKGAVSYKWYFKADEANGAVLVGTGASYTVVNVNQSGEYYCVMTIDGVEDTFVTDTVKVKITPVVITVDSLVWNYVPGTTVWVYNTDSYAVKVEGFKAYNKNNSGDTTDYTSYIDFENVVVSGDVSKENAGAAYKATATFALKAAIENTGNYVFSAADTAGVYDLTWSIAKAPVNVSDLKVTMVITDNLGNTYTFGAGNTLTFVEDRTYTVALVQNGVYCNGLLKFNGISMSENAAGKYTFAFAGDALDLISFVNDADAANYEIVGYDAFLAHVNTFNNTSWEIQVVAAHQHNYTIREDVTIATCIEKGTYYLRCSVDGCGDYEYEANGTEKKLYKEDINPNNHSWIAIAAKNPTDYEVGYTAHEKCEWCNITRGYIELPKLVSTKAPANGLTVTGPGADKFEANDVTCDYKNYEFPKGQFGKGLIGKIILAYDIDPKTGYAAGSSYTIVFDIPADYISHNNLAIYHFNAAGEAEEISVISIKDGKITFAASEFSVYALVAIEERNTTWWIWLVVALGALVLVGAVVMAVIVSRRRKAIFAEDKDENEDDNNTTAPVAEAPQTEGEKVDTTPSLGEAAIEVSELTSAQAESPVNEIAEEITETETVEEIPAEETVEETTVVEEEAEKQAEEEARIKAEEEARAKAEEEARAKAEEEARAKAEEEARIKAEEEARAKAEEEARIKAEEEARAKAEEEARIKAEEEARAKAEEEARIKAEEEARAAEAVVEEAPAQEEVVEETPAEEAPVAAAAEEDSIVLDGEVIYVHYRSSFTSRFIQAPETLQNYYATIKNYILSYTGVKAKTSWNYEIFTKGRTQCVKLNIKGKALTLNLALDPKEYNASKYHFTDLSDNPKFAALPMLLKVKSDRGLKYALELIAEVMSKLGIAQGEVPAVDYRMPYESNASLAKRGIVKVILPAGVKYDPNVEIREANVNDILDSEEDKTLTREEVFLYDNDDVADADIEETETEETATVETANDVEESVAAVTEKATESLGMPIIAADDTITVEGNVVLIRYRSSFTSRLIQADNDVQDYYTALKNHLLSYKGVKSRTSWNYETFAKGRVQCARINIKGKTLTVNLALIPSDYNVNKYHFTDLSDNPKFDKLPMLLKIRSARALKYALELIDELMKTLDVSVGTIQKVDYHKPYESNSELARRGLMKIILPAGVKIDETTILREENVDNAMDTHKVADDTAVETVVEAPVAEEVVEEAPAVEEVVEEAPAVEEVVEEAPAVEEIVEEAPVAEEVVEEAPAAEEVVEEAPAAEEVVEEAPVAEEVVEEAPVAEEVVEEAPAAEEAVEETPAVEEPVFTDAQHADEMINDAVAEKSIKVIKKSRSGKMVEVNIDDICANFEDGDEVTLEALKAKKLINKAAGRVKILAKGTMTKSLTVEADKFSLQAVKMITLAGGTAKRYN